MWLFWVAPIAGAVLSGYVYRWPWAAGEAPVTDEADPATVPATVSASGVPAYQV